MKPMPKSFLFALVLLPIISACGLRGGLERPDPIFRDISSVEEVMDDVSETPEIEDTERNEFGGEIPDAVPIEPIYESPIDDPVDNE